MRAAKKVCYAELFGCGIYGQLMRVKIPVNQNPPTVTTAVENLQRCHRGPVSSAMAEQPFGNTTDVHTPIDIGGMALLARCNEITEETAHRLIQTGCTCHLKPPTEAKATEAEAEMKMQQQKEGGNQSTDTEDETPLSEEKKTAILKDIIKLLKQMMGFGDDDADEILDLSQLTSWDDLSYLELQPQFTMSFLALHEEFDVTHVFVFFTLGANPDKQLLFFYMPWKEWASINTLEDPWEKCEKTINGCLAKISVDSYTIEGLEALLSEPTDDDNFVQQLFCQANRVKKAEKMSTLGILQKLYCPNKKQKLTQ